MKHTHCCASPIGELLLESDGEYLTGLWFKDGKYCPNISDEQADTPSEAVFKLAEKWLEIYFGGAEPDFTPPLRLDGTDFRKEVWEILKTIPYGETVTYGEIAERIAKRRGLSRMSAQAVGGAVGRNPVSIIVPCHRVIAADGTLAGYAGGIDKKVFLLRLEKAIK